MHVRNPSLASFSRRATIIVFAFVMPAAASAGDAPSNDYYVGGFVGAGAARSIDPGMFADTGPSVLDLFYVPSPPTSAQSGGAAPSFSLVFGANRSVMDGVSVGLEFEGEYQGARSSSSGSYYAVFPPLLPFEGSDTLQTFTQWSVPAQAALRARASFQIAPSVSIFGSLGPTLGYARFRATFTQNQNIYGYMYIGSSYQFFDANFITNASAGKSFVDLGISLSAGMEVAVAPNVGLRGEYSFATFSSIVERDPWGFTSARATPTFQDARLGIVRHF